MGKRLYVGNLPYDADEASLRAAFGQDGRTVDRVHIVLDRETQRPRGFAFVEMATEDQARKAIEAMNGAVFGTRQLRVTEAEERRPPGPGGPGGPRGDRPPMAGPRSAGGPGAGGPAAGGAAGGAAPAGGGPRFGDDAARTNRFGPDARPKREREQEHRRPQPRRRDDTDEDYGGRRGHRRYDDDDDE